MSGVINVTGVNPNGATNLQVLIVDVSIPEDDDAEITDFGVTAGDPGSDTNSIFYLEVSKDGFTVDVRVKSVIEIIRAGTVFKSLANPIRVAAGEDFRVRFKQGTKSRVSAEIFGRTKHNDIRD